MSYYNFTKKKALLGATKEPWEVGVGRSEVWGNKLPANQRMRQEKKNKKMQPCDIISEGIEVLFTNTPG